MLSEIFVFIFTILLFIISVCFTISILFPLFISWLWAFFILFSPSINLEIIHSFSGCLRCFNLYTYKSKRVKLHQYFYPLPIQYKDVWKLQLQSSLDPSSFKLWLWGPEYSTLLYFNHTHYVLLLLYIVNIFLALNTYLPISLLIIPFCVRDYFLLVVNSIYFVWKMPWIR